MSTRTELIGSKPNKCCVFVLPMCDINHKSMPKNFFINCYLNYDKGKDNYQIVIVLERPPDGSLALDHFIDYVIYNKNFSHREDYDDEIVLFFNIPESNKSNYELFLAGKYSKFTDQFKKQLESYHGNARCKANYEVFTYDVIEPTDAKRLQIAQRLYSAKDLPKGLLLIDEVYDCPNLEKEKYKSINQIIESNQIIKSNDNKQQNPI